MFSTNSWTSAEDINSRKCRGFNTNCFRILSIILFLIFTVIVLSHGCLCSHWYQKQHKRQKISTSCLKFKLLLFLFFSECTNIIAFIKNLTGDEEKPFLSTVLYYGRSYSWFISKTPTPLITSKICTEKSYCGVLSLFLYVPVQDIARWINKYCAYKKLSDWKTKHFIIPIFFHLFMFWNHHKFHWFFCI